MDEYIKKESALCLLRNLAKEPAYQHDGEDYYVGICEASGVINEMNPADVAPVQHAKWEVVVGSDGKEHMICTGCRKQQDLTGVFSYCQNCGCRMDGGDDE